MLRLSRVVPLDPTQRDLLQPVLVWRAEKAGEVRPLTLLWKNEDVAYAAIPGVPNVSGVVVSRIAATNNTAWNTVVVTYGAGAFQRVVWLDWAGMLRLPPVDYVRVDVFCWKGINPPGLGFDLVAPRITASLVDSSDAPSGDRVAVWTQQFRADANTADVVMGSFETALYANGNTPNFVELEGVIGAAENTGATGTQYLSFNNGFGGAYGSYCKLLDNGNSTPRYRVACRGMSTETFFHPTAIGGGAAMLLAYQSV